jgi:hypothetical protein
MKVCMCVSGLPCYNKLAKVSHKYYELITQPKFAILNSALAHQTAYSYVAQCVSSDLLQLDTPEKKQEDAKQSNLSQLQSKEPVVADPIVSSIQEDSSATHTSTLIDSPEGSESCTAPSVEKSPEGVDRLLFCSPSSTSEGSSPSTNEMQKSNVENSELVNVLMYTQQDIDEKVQECQRQVEQEIAMLQSSVTQKEEELVRLKKEYADMQHVVDDYQRLLSEHCESNEQRMSALTEAQRERDQTLADFNSLETAFAAQHKRYEKLKVLYDKAKKVSWLSIVGSWYHFSVHIGVC